MSDNRDEPTLVQADLEAIATAAQALATRHQGNAKALLKLLRMLESLHRDIRDGLFQDCLPNNRQILYAMLRDMESEGGWPYIPRMKLRSLLAQLLEEDDKHGPDSTAVSADSPHTRRS